MQKDWFYAAAALACALCVASPAWADGEAEGEQVGNLSADHPGFSDGSATVGALDVQAELGAEVARPSSGQVDVGLSALVRFGVLDFAELRLEVPSFMFGLTPGDSGAATTAMDSIEMGAKLSLPLGDSFQLAFLPYLITPSGLESSPNHGLGGGLGIITDIALNDALGITASVVPRLASYELIAGSEDTVTTDRVFELDAALGLGWSLRDDFIVFAEGWMQYASGDVSPAGNMGLIWYLNPDVMFDAYVGLQVPGDLVPYGGVGFVYRYR